MVLSLPGNTELLQELPQSLVKRQLTEGEQLKHTVSQKNMISTTLPTILHSHSLGEVGGEDVGCGGGGDMTRQEPTSGVIVPELEPPGLR